MNSSAKLSLSVLLVASLGAVAFACTVTSGTVDDVDGGPNPGTSTSSSTSSSGTAVTPPDAGDTVCPQSNGYAPIDSAQCQSCLDTSCCAQTAGCWTIATEPGDGGALGCSDFSDEIDKCDDNANPDQCKTFAKAAAVAAVPGAYNTYLACRTTSCAAACPTVAGDAGP